MELLNQLILKSDPEALDSLWRILIEYQKLLHREVREDARISQDSAARELRAAADDAARDNRAAQVNEAREKMQAAMDAARETGVQLAPSLNDPSTGIGAELAGILEDAYGEMSTSEIEELIQEAIDGLQMRLGAEPGESGNGSKKPMLIGAGALGLLALVAGLWFLRAPQAGSVTPQPATGTPPAASPVPTAADVPGAICSIQFLSPARPEDVPLAGPLVAEWAAVGDAVSYSLEVVQPESAGNPWRIATDGTSKRLFMENFPAAGDYELRVSAIANDGKTLCTGTFEFEKDAYDPETGRRPDEAPAPCGPNDPYCQ